MTELEQVENWRSRAMDGTLEEKDYVEIANYLRSKYSIETPSTAKESKKPRIEIDTSEL